MKVAPWPRLLRDLGRRRARTTRLLSNGWGMIPAGTVGHVVGWHSWSDLSFTADPCARCGCRASISRLSRRDVELIEPEQG